MKISIALLTFNQFLTGRRNLFLQTLESIQREPNHFTLDVVTNGSTDATDKVVRKLGGIVDNTQTQSWYGFELAMRAALSRRPDIVVLSADDITYTPGWMDKLAAFWAAAPEDIKLATCFLEGLWSWNAVTDAIDVAGLRVLIRDSVPSASWTFRASDADLILPLERIMPGEDLALSTKLRNAGYRLAALDLAEHTGARQSAWGNRSFEYEQPLDRTKWGLPE